ncbi:MAG: tetratricopeptide repeat protein, partial [Parachlamydiaceae bacterium]
MCLHELREKIVEERMEETLVNNHLNLLPPAIQKDKINSEIYEEITAIIKRIERAATLLGNPPELKKLGEVNWGVAKWDDTFTYKEICGFDEKLMRSFRTKGTELYNDEKYREASDVFFLLALIDWKLPYHWSSLGHSEYYSGNYRDAINAYASAALLDPKDPRPLLHTAFCYEKQHQIQAAIDCLLDALPLTRDSIYKDWEGQIKIYLEKLRSQNE